MYPQIEQLKHTDSGMFFLLAGPCVIEGEEMAMHIAETIVEITDKWKIPYIFKGSYRKANHSQVSAMKRRCAYYVKCVRHSVFRW